VFALRSECRFQQAFHEIDIDERHVESVDFAHLVLVVVWNMLHGAKANGTWQLRWACHFFYAAHGYQWPNV
jgi:hypothetical protein